MPRRPENFNAFQDEDGCPDDPDTDGDGIPDSKDACPNLPEDKDGYLDDDGCPDPDNDGDGILDKLDKCPDQPEDPDGFEDNDGCPEPDNDKDGVLDLDDACPIDPGPADNKGCPKKPALVVVTSSQIKITQQIHFEFNKSVIKADSFPILNAVAQVLKDNPDITLEIGGHTDNVGKPEYNKKLSQDRSDSVRKYLIDKGISGSRLTAKGYGMDVPIDTNSNEAGRAKNRRVEFVRTDAK
ncbi:MAG: OmpA family protein [Myxococcales bacterium]|nr:OmpA family protein [Myxococcales bacterium]